MSDELRTIAQGLGFVERRSDPEVIRAISEMVEEYSVKEIVVGRPINMDGSVGPMAEKAEKFAGQLEEALGIEVKLWDERLSTVEAEKLLIKGGVKRRGRKKVVDKIAASLILQGYIDSLRFNED
jgi:putative Holliday junction resolvase